MGSDEDDDIYYDKIYPPSLAVDDESRVDYQNDEITYEANANREADIDQTVAEPVETGNLVDAHSHNNGEANSSMAPLFLRPLKSRTARVVRRTAHVGGPSPSARFFSILLRQAPTEHDQMIDRAEQSLSSGSDIAHIVTMMEKHSQKDSKSAKNANDSEKSSVVVSGGREEREL
ncbi:unnamed protein product [Aphanomyces euteiches]|nr:hypothetical protein Ae201684P_019442 [Aphanomyces euteiches]